MIQFAREGYEAVGIDISARGLKKAEAWAKKENIVISTIQSDLVSFRLGEEFDVVYSSGTLTYLLKMSDERCFQTTSDSPGKGGLTPSTCLWRNPFLKHLPIGGLMSTSTSLVSS